MLQFNFSSFSKTIGYVIYPLCFKVNFDKRRDVKITTPQFVWALAVKGLVPLLAYLSFAPPGVGNGSPTKPL